MDEKYNGWTNYETWVANVWMGEDTKYFEDMADMYDTTYDLSKALQFYFDNTNPLEQASMFRDLLTRSLGKVNWYEIAEHLKLK